MVPYENQKYPKKWHGNPHQENDDEDGAELVQLRKKSAASHDDEVDLGKVAQARLLFRQ